MSLLCCCSFAHSLAHLHIITSISPRCYSLIDSRSSRVSSADTLDHASLHQWSPTRRHVADSSHRRRCSDARDTSPSPPPLLLLVLRRASHPSRRHSHICSSHRSLLHPWTRWMSLIESSSCTIAHALRCPRARATMTLFATRSAACFWTACRYERARERPRVYTNASYVTDRMWSCRIFAIARSRPS